MAMSSKNKINKKKKGVSEKAKNIYANDPFFMSKREAALTILKKTGLPESFTEKK